MNGPPGKPPTSKGRPRQGGQFPPRKVVSAEAVSGSARQDLHPGAKPSPPTSCDPVSQLCPACGLCCNGVLFGDVELQPGDDAESLSKLGLMLFRKGRKTSLRQPCACFDGKGCRVYGQRPERCRTFECRLLERARAGEVAPVAALAAITEARRRAESVRRLVRELGQRDETVPLNRRYAAVVAEPIDLTAEDARLERRSELMLAVGKLVKWLEAEFLQ